MGSRRDCTWILGLAGFRVVTIESDGEAADSRVTIRMERRGAGATRAVAVVGERSRPIGAESDVGRCAVGVASGHAGVCAAAVRCRGAAFAPSGSSSRMPKGAGDAALAAADRGGLPVDADIACGGPPRRQLGESPARGARVPARLGRPASSPSAAASGGRRDSPRQGAEVLHRAVGPRARRGDRLGERPDGGQLGGLARHECNDAMLLLKLKWATARPIRTARDLCAFCSLRSGTQIGEEPEDGVPSVASPRLEDGNCILTRWRRR